ncbi:MAG: glycosyltransferase family 1 protein, partial [Nodosilinea sp.]
LKALLSTSLQHDIDVLIFSEVENVFDCQALVNSLRSSAKIWAIPEKISPIGKFLYIFKKNIHKALVKLKFPICLRKSFGYLHFWFKASKIDLLYIPYQIPPSYDFSFPYIVTMHDVQELHYPEFFTPQERAWRAMSWWKSLENASAVIVSFSHVKNDLIKYFNISDGKVKVCPLPYKEIELHTPDDCQEIAYRKKYESFEQFILYPAQFWKHKNHISIVKALEIIYERQGKQVHVAFTGEKSAKTAFPDLQDYVSKSQVSNYVHFIGNVPEAELLWLYKHCSLVTISTLYEAGSFPLLEAMACGTPVVCSAVTSLPETIGDQRFLFNPQDVEELANLILSMLSDDQLRIDNIENSYSMIKKLRNTPSASCFVDVFEKVYKQSNIKVNNAKH